jgi:putative membrane protein
MKMPSDVRLERLSRYVFTAPSWQRSLVILIVLGLIIDGASLRGIGNIAFFGTIAFTFPALVAFFLTKPMVEHIGKPMTWNRSALLALSCTVFSVIITLSAFIASPVLLRFFYAFSFGFTFALRLLVLVAIADYRISRMIVPAATQSVAGVIAGALLFSQTFILYGVFLLIIFGLLSGIFIWLIDRPLYRAFNIRGLNFINAFIAHLTDGSKELEGFFREIGEEVTVPQVSFFFRRTAGRGVLLTVPNVHPGPMGEIGGGNLPKLLHDAFPEEVLAPHGCATHDFNLVSESEIYKIIQSIKTSQVNAVYSGFASRSRRVQYRSVSLLCQGIGDSILIVGTRSPEMTEDLDVAIGMTIMAEGHRFYPNIAFIDAHNCMTHLAGAVLPATLIATEYFRGSVQAMQELKSAPLVPFRIGVSHRTLPFSREEGFGDLGIQALVIDADGQRTAYVLLDGNNVATGVRELLRDAVLDLVDEAEIMTTDSHVVNTITGKNPVGQNVPAKQIVPYVKECALEALNDLGQAEVAAATAECERIVVFGSNRIAQLASTVNAMLVFIAPLSVAVLLLAFLLSLILYTVML